MNLKSKQLYHQIHPLKLLVDFSTAFVSLYFLWIHELVLGLIIAIIPSIVTSYLMLNFMDFVKQENSGLGKYVALYMSRKIEGMRFMGFIIMVIGAWYDYSIIIIIGLLLVVLAWMNGLIWPRK